MQSGSKEEANWPQPLLEIKERIKNILSTLCHHVCLYTGCLKVLSLIESEISQTGTRHSFQEMMKFRS